MRIKDEYILREVSGVNVVVAIGEAARDFHGIANLNDTGALLFKGLKNGLNADELARSLTDTYDVGDEQAQHDIDRFVRALQNAGMLAE